MYNGISSLIMILLKISQIFACMLKGAKKKKQKKNTRLKIISFASLLSLAVFIDPIIYDPLTIFYLSFIVNFGMIWPMPILFLIKTK